MNIREAKRDDLDGIFAIYDREVLHGTATFDTVVKSTQERLDWFATAGQRYPVLVAEEKNRVLGWARAYAWSPRRAYDRTAENAVYVRDDARGRGLGRALMEKLIELAPQHGIHVLVARIVEGNPASVRLHEALGFKTIGVMRQVGEKFGTLLDVRLMDLHLDHKRA
ncbi:MAG TPA: GNAT family N-acetyltransferase [Nevskiaceae bacterium]|nr:GNAT family N-acetyltransferase [Nevskiaceae bacterium]